MTIIERSEKIKVEYTEKKIFGGMIKWYEVAQTTSMGKFLRINTTDKFDEVFVNGERYVKEEL